jgi:hypothetical protein
MKTPDYEGVFGQSVAEPRRHGYAGLRPQAEVALGLRSTADDLLRCFAPKKLYPIRREALRATSTEKLPYVNQPPRRKE